MGIGAVLSEPGSYGFAALFLLSGALELVFWKDDASKSVDSIGDYGNPFQFGIGSPIGESEDMRNRELNNGRAAMFAALGIMLPSWPPARTPCSSSASRCVRHGCVQACNFRRPGTFSRHSLSRAQGLPGLESSTQLQSFGFV